MATQTTQASVSRGRKIGFYVAVVATILLLIIALLEAFTLTVTSWFPGTLEELYGDESVAIDSHRIHLFGVAILSWLALLPVAAQLIRPDTKVAPAVFALAAFAIVTAIDLLTGLFDPLEVVLVVLVATIFWLHPGRSGMSLTPARRRGLTVALAGGVGWVVYAGVQLSDQLTGLATDEHVEFHHFGIMGQVALLIAIAALIGTSALTGRRIAAILSAGAAAYLGLASVANPNLESSLEVPLGLAAILWAAVYLWSVLSESRSPAPV